MWYLPASILPIVLKRYRSEVALGYFRANNVAVGFGRAELDHVGPMSAGRNPRRKSCILCPYSVLNERRLAH